jgi:hypothetical protein
MELDNLQKEYFQKLRNFFEPLMLHYRNYEKSYEKELDTFFQPLILNYRLIGEAEKQFNKFLASDFNLVGIFFPDENRISDIIANLLKPNGKHGQGEVFLLKFLEILNRELENNQLNIETLDLSKAEIYREYAIDEKRRIDILIKFANGFVIGIENKPWAGEQIRQLEDYSKFLKSTSKENYLLVYLTGYEIEALSIDKNLKEELKRKSKFLETDYQKLLIPWLEECYKECRAEKVRWFLLDFINWIKNNFRGGIENG